MALTRFLLGSRHGRMTVCPCSTSSSEADTSRDVDSKIQKSDGTVTADMYPRLVDVGGVMVFFFFSLFWYTTFRKATFNL